MGLHFKYKDDNMSAFLTLIIPLAVNDCIPLAAVDHKWPTKGDD